MMAQGHRGGVRLQGWQFGQQASASQREREVAAAPNTSPLPPASPAGGPRAFEVSSPMEVRLFFSALICSSTCTPGEQAFGRCSVQWVQIKAACSILRRAAAGRQAAARAGSSTRTRHQHPPSSPRSATACRAGCGAPAPQCACQCPPLKQQRSKVQVVSKLVNAGQRTSHVCRRAARRRPGAGMKPATAGLLGCLAGEERTHVHSAQHPPAARLAPPTQASWTVAALQLLQRTDTVAQPPTPAGHAPLVNLRLLFSSFMDDRAESRALEARSSCARICCFWPCRRQAAGRGQRQSGRRLAVRRRQRREPAHLPMLALQAAANAALA